MCSFVLECREIDARLGSHSVLYHVESLPHGERSNFKGRRSAHGKDTQGENVKESGALISITVNMPDLREI